MTAVFGDKLAEKPVVELKEVLGESRAASSNNSSKDTRRLMFAGKIPSQEAYSIAKQTEAFLRLMLKLLS